MNIVKSILTVVVILNTGCAPSSLDGIFTCEINGEEFQSQSAYCIEFSNSYESIFVLDPDSEDIIFSIQTSPRFESSTYLLDENSWGRYGTEGILLFNWEGDTYEPLSGFLTITSRTEDRMVGEFEVTFVDNHLEGSSTVAVTNGYFDIPCLHEEITQQE